MSIYRSVLMIAGLALCGIAPCGTARAAATIETYGSLPNVEDMTLSPDGTRDAYVTRSPERSLVVIQDLKSGKLIKALNVGDQKLRGLQWASDDYLVILTSTAIQIPGLIGPMQEYYSGRYYSVSKDRMFPILDKDIGDLQTLHYVLAGYVQARMVDGTPMVFVPGLYFINRKSRRGLFRINLDDHSMALVDDTSGDAGNWVVGRNGELIARDNYDEVTGAWSVSFMTSAGWSVRYQVKAPLDHPTLVSQNPTGDGVLVHAPYEGGAHLLNVFADPAKPLATLPGNTEAVNFDPTTGRVIALYDSAYHFVDPNDQRLWNGLEKAYKDGGIALVTESADGAVMIIEVDGPTDGVVFSYVDRKTKTATWIADRYKGLSPSDLSPVRMISYPAADGLTIPAVLTLPRNRPAKDLPLVVLPHGGPALRDEPGFDWWSQALAAQGYAVLQPEYRGSAGFGEAFQAAGYGEWGRKMQSDLSDGARFLAKDGIIDPARVAIVGNSYGGYAALAGAAFDPGVYRCAVSVAGPSDLRKLLEYELNKAHKDDNFATRFWMRYMGAKSVDDPALAAISPALHADQVKIPVLLIQGEDDTVVPFKQSQIMKEALEDAHKPVTFVKLEEEDHWLSRSATRTQMLNATIDFLKVNNPP